MVYYKRGSKVTLATDPLTGISENIMLGQQIPGGTGSFNLMLDIDKERFDLAKPNFQLY